MRQGCRLAVSILPWRSSGSAGAETHTSWWQMGQCMFAQSPVGKLRSEQTALLSDADCEAGESPIFMGSNLLESPENPSLIPADCLTPLTGQRVVWLVSSSWDLLSESTLGNHVEKQAESALRFLILSTREYAAT